MSDAKHQGYIGPNDPVYYAPRELRERATSGQLNTTPDTLPPDEVPPDVVPQDTVLKQASEWRPRLAAEGSPLQPVGRPQRREQSEVFSKAVAQALQEAKLSGPIEAPSVLRENAGRRAVFSVAIRFALAVAIAASIAAILVMAIPASQRPAGQSADTSSIAAIWQSIRSSGSAPSQKRVPTLATQDGGGFTNDTVPLGIHVGSAPPDAFVAINGLAAGARLTSGRRNAVNEWRVPASEVSGVTVIPPNGFVGQMVLTAELRDGTGSALASGSTRLSWTSAAAAATRAPAAVAAPPASVAPPAAVAAVAPSAAVAPQAVVTPPQAPVAPVAPVTASRPPQAETLRTLDPREVSGLVARGQELLASGDVQSARLLLQRGAEAGDGRSALLLGTTYDPTPLRQLGASGLADIAQARHWYQRAREWGQTEAQRRLEALALSR
jgi:TPR repeat protein